MQAEEAPESGEGSEMETTSQRAVTEEPRKKASRQWTAEELSEALKDKIIVRIPASISSSTSSSSKSHSIDDHRKSSEFVVVDSLHHLHETRRSRRRHRRRRDDVSDDDDFVESGKETTEFPAAENRQFYVTEKKEEHEWTGRDHRETIADDGEPRDGNLWLRMFKNVTNLDGSWNADMAVANANVNANTNSDVAGRNSASATKERVSDGDYEGKNLWVLMAKNILSRKK